MAVQEVPGRTGRWRDERKAARTREASNSRRIPVAIRAGLVPWVPFWMALGIGAWLAVPFEPGLFSYLAIAAIGVVALFVWQFVPAMAEAGHVGWERAEWLRIVCLAIMLVASGTGLAGLRSHLVAAPILHFRYYGPVEGRVVEIDRSARDRIRLTLDRVVLDDMSADRVPARVRVSLYDADPLPVPGERVMLTAHLGPPPGPAEPGGFDFRRMAWFERLGAIGYARTPVVTLEPPGGSMALHRLRMQLSAGIQDSIGGQAGAVASALITGDRSGIEERTNEIMRASNLYHIVSISGLHMSLVSGFIYAALRFVGAVGQGFELLAGARVHKYAAFGALIAAAGYLWLSGGDVATKRSFIMVAVMLIAIMADRRAVSLRTVALAAIFILAMTPEALASAGFQMSFAATVALILSSGPWQRVAPHLPWWIKPAAMLIVSSLVASFATSPIAAANFGRISHYGLLANLLVVPVVGVLVMPAGVIAGLLAPLGLADLPLWFMGWGIRWMLLIADLIAGLKGATTLLPAPPGVVLPLLGIGACLATLHPITGARGGGWASRSRRIVGVGLVLMAALLWGINKRPTVLISAEGDAVGIMTPEGRALSKPKGGAFVAAEWLEADGNLQTQEMAAKNPLWQGKSTARMAGLDLGAGDLTIYHLTGKSALANFPSHCSDQTIVVSNVDLGLGKAPKDCVLLDRSSLRESGAVSIDLTREGMKISTARAMSGSRSWSKSTKRRSLPAQDEKHQQ